MQIYGFISLKEVSLWVSVLPAQSIRATIDEVQLDLPGERMLITFSNRKLCTEPLHGRISLHNPQMGRINNVGDEGGQFIFIRK
ncbi:hypothetical protein [Eisenibacter elegans]|uniref:hypothetical protein n=1 Tax=Eisenibacter elegans TaxID=997 RepID=UPI00047E16A1|nr:hypothetical protein [Eisenibacter elegans]